MEGSKPGQAVVGYPDSELFRISIAHYKPKMEFCTAQLFKRYSELNSKILIKMRIKADGSTDSFKITGDKPVDRATINCVNRTIQSYYFHPNGKPEGWHVTYPFTLSSKDR